MKFDELFKSKPLCLAPMEDVTDTPFRLICKRLGADILYTEFTSSEALIRDARKALDKILVTDEERPIAIQIFGGREESMAGAAKIAASAHPDFIDINCGCWVRNHAARGEGAGLLKDLKKMERVVKITVGATSLPVTVKTRLGWDAKNIVILDVAKMVEQAGVKALTVHCRTRQQGHKGHADWEWLSRIKKAVSIPVIGNGDVKTAEDVKIMLETGCDGVMIGRGAIVNPWIFGQSKEYLKTGLLSGEPELQEKIDTCLEHLRLSVQFKGKQRGINDFKKHYSGYLRGLPGVAKLRSQLVKLKEPEEVTDCLMTFLKGRAHIQS